MVNNKSKQTNETHTFERGSNIPSQTNTPKMPSVKPTKSDDKK